VHSGRRVYAQLMDVLPLSEFRRCVLGFPQSLCTIPGPIHGRKLRGDLHRSLALAVQRVNGERMMTRWRLIPMAPSFSRALKARPIISRAVPTALASACWVNRPGRRRPPLPTGCP
jgi:hypothetical protein